MMTVIENVLLWGRLYNADSLSGASSNEEMRYTIYSQLSFHVFLKKKHPDHLDSLDNCLGTGVYLAGSLSRVQTCCQKSQSSYGKLEWNGTRILKSIFI